MFKNCINGIWHIEYLFGMFFIAECLKSSTPKTLQLEIFSTTVIISTGVLGWIGTVALQNQKLLIYFLNTFNINIYGS